MDYKSDIDGRTVGLSPRAIEILRTLEPGDDPRIFRMQPSSITQAWNRIKKRAGLQSNLRLHDMRHEAISRLFEMGLGIAEVGSISGHKDWRSLKSYTHPRPEDVAKTLKRLADRQGVAPHLECPQGVDDPDAK